MALNITPKASSTTSTQPVTPHVTTQRPQVTYGKPAASTARVDALKARLAGKPAPAAPVQAPRKAGSSARAEQYAAQPKYAPTPTPQKPVIQARTSARTKEVDPSTLPPPPSGLAPGATPPPNGVETAPAEPAVSEIDNGTGTPVEAEANNQPLSPQFAALAKQERAIRRARQELKAAQDAWKQTQGEFIRKSELVEKPLEKLAEAGLTYEKLTELQLGQVNPDPNQQLLTKISDLEAKLAAVNGEFEKRDTQSYDAALNQIRKDAKLLVDSDESFETIRAYDAMGPQYSKDAGTEAVVDLIKREFDRTGEVLSVEDAAKLVEEKALDREVKRIQRFNALSKIKTRLSPPEVPAEATPAAVTTPSPTLTNQGAVQRPLTPYEKAIQAVERRMAQIRE